MWNEDELSPEQQNWQRWKAWNALVSERGKRYGNCSIDNFVAPNDAAQKAISDICEYCASIDQQLGSGRGVVLFGSRGTGKDHLAMGICKEAIRRDVFSIRWVNGADMFGDARDLISDGGSEKDFVRRLVLPSVLYISDPVPPSGSITEFQASLLFRILDGRYSAGKPTIATVNVASRAELDTRIGSQNSDRLRDGALCVACAWSSYRKPLEIEVKS